MRDRHETKSLHKRPPLRIINACSYALTQVSLAGPLNVLLDKSTKHTISAQQHRVTSPARKPVQRVALPTSRTKLKREPGRRISTLPLVRASMVYVPAGCGLMPTSGRWYSMLVHSCTGSYKPDWANCFTGELRHEHAKLHTGPSGRTCLTGDFHEHVHTVISPSRRRFSRRTLRFRISVVYEHNTIALRTRAIANLQTAFTAVQKSHVSSCCGLELICRDLLCVGRSAIPPLSVSLARIRRRTCRDSLLAAAALATRA
ncbi:unnamed protein product [Trichogramma brassicae]|uniref:Uncharacterized protein n=1 Tax=Trichogramma brassicae TaxID=86971 RepID=A0A6H5IK89_9HYME|nr:unnamed protein product [Trichogramma brassicae]